MMFGIGKLYGACFVELYGMKFLIFYLNLIQLNQCLEFTQGIIIPLWNIVIHKFIFSNKIH